MLELDIRRRRVFRSGISLWLRLTKLDLELLSFLILNQGKVLSFQDLYEGAWAESYFGSCEDNIVRHRVFKLRKLLGPEFQLITIRAFGFRLLPSFETGFA